MLTGDGAEVFVRPAAVAQREGVLYVADPGAQSLWLIDRPRGRYSRLANIGADALVSPVALAVRADGSVFVADTALKKVFLVTRDGAPVRTIALQGLERPAGLAWDETARRLYVLDSVRHRIAVFDGNGALLRHLGEAGDRDGQFNHPTHVALDAGGTLLVTDALNFRVQALDRDGRFLWKFGQVGDGAGDFAAPKGVAADREGNVYVADAMFDAVQIFDRTGALLLGFGSRGTGRGEFSLPGGIFIADDGRIYVADTYNRRVQIFSRVPEPAAEAGK